MSGRQRRWLRPVVVGVGAAVLVWLLGVHPADAALIGGIMGVATGLPMLLGTPTGVEVVAPEKSRGTGSWEPVRRMEMLLRQSADGPDAFHHRLRPRLREVAERWLARQGHRWEDQAAQHLLGPELHRLLSARGGSREAGGAHADPVAVTEMLAARLRTSDDHGYGKQEQHD